MTPGFISTRDESDAYPMKSIDDILSKVSKAKYIHKSSDAYVERQVDLILTEIDAADSYCDGLVAASGALEYHIHAFRAVFNTGIGPKKPSVVNAGIEAVEKTEFPGYLERGLAGFNRHFIPLYSIIVQPLEQRKRNLLRVHRRPKETCKHLAKKWSAAIPFVMSSNAELALFEETKAQLANGHAKDSPLFIELDVSKVGIGGLIYHVDEKGLPGITGTDGQTKVAYRGQPSSRSRICLALLQMRRSDTGQRRWSMYAPCSGKPSMANFATCPANLMSAGL